MTELQYIMIRTVINTELCRLDIASIDAINRGDNKSEQRLNREYAKLTAAKEAFITLFLKSQENI